jgi:hypothetical protein
MAESFQSNVLCIPNPPPNDDLNLSVEAKNLSPLVAYGF